MINNLNIPESYIPNPSSFGGEIYYGDFESKHSIAYIAKRIASDMRFDDKCRKNTESRELRKKNGK